jgi:polar amino acid transport system substrate-binding protein
MKFLGLCGVLLAAGLATGGAKAQEAAVKELIPTGKLRFGVAFAPKMSALFVVKDAGGSPRGVTADLGNELAQRLGVSIEFMVAPNTGVLTDALASAAIDVAFMPVDEERKKRLEFGPAYCLVESTYMVTAASGIRTLAEVDRPGVRVVGIANTTTIRAAGRSLINTVPIAVTSIDDAVAMLRAGQADAFALGRDSLPSFVAEFPGSHIVDGAVGFFGATTVVHENLGACRSQRKRAGAPHTARSACDEGGFS